MTEPATLPNILTFEATTAGGFGGGAAATRVRTTFGISLTKYHHLLSVIFNPDSPLLRTALELDAITTNVILDRITTHAEQRTTLTAPHQKGTS